MITSWAPMPFILSNSPSPWRSRVPSTRSTGNWFGTTRSVQPGPFAAVPLRCASSSRGVMCSCPSQKGHETSGAICTDSRRKSVGRLRRSVEMITQRPVTGSLRSSHDIYIVVSAGSASADTRPQLQPSKAFSYTSTRGRPRSNDDRDHVESAGLIGKAAPRQKVYRHPGNPVLLHIGHGGGGPPKASAALALTSTNTIAPW